MLISQDQLLVVSFVNNIRAFCDLFLIKCNELVCTKAIFGFNSIEIVTTAVTSQCQNFPLNCGENHQLPRGVNS